MIGAAARLGHYVIDAFARDQAVVLQAVLAQRMGTTVRAGQPVPCAVVATSSSASPSRVVLLGVRVAVPTAAHEGGAVRRGTGLLSGIGHHRMML